MSGVKSLYSAPLYIDDTPSLSIFELRTKARRLVREHQVKIIIIEVLPIAGRAAMIIRSEFCQPDVSLSSSWNCVSNPESPVSRFAAASICSIYAAIQQLGASQQPIDMLTVTERLRANGALDEVGGPVYISGLTAKVASGAILPARCKLVEFVELCFQS